MAEKAPDPSKRSFAPTEAEMQKQQSATTEQVKEIPSAEVSLHIMNGKLEAILEEMKTLNNLFKYTKSIMGQKPDTMVALPQSPPTTASAQAPAPTPAPEISPRVKEILAALEPVKDLLRIDTEESTMMVMVRPAQFLGSDNFSKVAAIVRNLGGQYVSAGKNSHFEVPKAPRKA
jgi:hypothetical protein